MRGAEDLQPALSRITDGFYRMYRKGRVMTAIWQATPADRALQELDKYDCEYLADLLADALRPFTDDDPKEIKTSSRLIMTLIGAAVRHANMLTADAAQPA